VVSRLRLTENGEATANASESAKAFLLISAMAFSFGFQMLMAGYMSALALFDPTDFSQGNPWTMGMWLIFMIEFVVRIAFIAVAFALLLNQSRAKRGSCIAFGLVLVYYVVFKVLIPLDVMFSYPCVQADYCSDPLFFTMFVRCYFESAFWSLSAATVIVIRNARSAVRTKYRIPMDHSVFAAKTDCFYSALCPCLAAAQMSRHTTDYNVYPFKPWTDRGIPKDAPSIV
jgi:hypothetical protein